MYNVRIECSDPGMLSHLIFQINEIGAVLLGVEVTEGNHTPVEVKPRSKPKAINRNKFPRNGKAWSEEELGALKELMEEFDEDTFRSWNKKKIMPLLPGRSWQSIYSKRYAILYPDAKHPKE